MIRVEGLRKVYRPGRKGEVVALDDLSFGVAPGELVGILGPNGAGKTTAIKCVCTLVRPTAGSIHVGGADAVAHPRHAVAKVAAVLEGNRNIWWRMTVRENLEFAGALHGRGTREARPEAEALADRLGLGDKLKVPARMISRGMQQKLSIACALIRRTPVLMLDEPTLGLDVETTVEIRAILRELVSDERAIVLTSHDMKVVQAVSDRVVVVNHGRVVADDTVANLLSLLRAQAYRLTLAGRVPAALEARLRASVPAVEVTPDTTTTAVRVELAGSRDLYALMDVLRAEGAVVEGIVQLEPDLEEVFLHLVKERR